MEVIDIYHKNEVHMKLDCERGTAMEISSYFTFEVPGAKFMPAYKSGIWDGKLRLFNVNTMLLYVGLIEHVRRFCEERGYKLRIHDGLCETNDVAINELESLNEDDYQLRDYQSRAVAHAIRNNRALVLSPTASGKSFIIYSIVKYYFINSLIKKALVIVPTTSLVTQMNSDFNDYSKERTGNYTHLIMSGQAKNDENAKIFISTWQSIYKMPKKYFDQFDLIIGDEAHLFKAKSLTSIMEKMPNCKYRFGFTGTLDDTQTNKLVLEGLFGPVMKVINTKELIDKGTLSDFRIKALVLKYPEEVCRQNKKMSYQEEMDFLVSNPKRNAFVKNLALTREGNTLLLFQYVDKHGKLLYNMIKNEVKDDRHVFFVHGGIDAEERERVRTIVEGESDAIIIASYGTFSTGINIRNLHNVIFASPSKSKIRNLQSIGRVLRKGNNKDSATLYDIADDLSHKAHHNYTLKHFAVRISTYNKEEFDYKIYNIRLNYAH